MSDNHRSSLITSGAERTPNRAMLRAVGFGDADFEKPIVGVANGYSTITPCNMGLNDLADRAIGSLHDAAGLWHDYRQRWHFDGDGGDEIQPCLSRCHCRFDRDGVPGAER